MIAGLTDAWTQLTPHPTQQALFACEKRFVTIPAGRGSGKTELALRKIVLSLTQRKRWPDPRYFIAGPTISHIKDIAWDRLLDLIPPDWLRIPPLRSKDAMIIKTRWGSSVQFFGLDGKRCRIEGRQWDGGFVDESSDCQPGVFDRAIVPALTWRDGWCWRTGVPKRQGQGAVEFRTYHEQTLKEKPADRAAFWWPSSDIVPQSMLDYAKRTLDPKDYDEQFNANFVTAGGALFWAFDEEKNVAPCAYHRSVPMVVACDFNRDPMAWAIGHRYENRMEWVDEMFLHDANTREALDVLWGRYGTRQTGPYEFYCDSAGSQRKTSAQRNITGELNTDLVEILNDERFKRSPGGRVMQFPRRQSNGKLQPNPPIHRRVSETNAMLLNAAGERRMIVDPRCERLIDDLRIRAEHESRGMIGHISDAVGYAVHKLFPIEIKSEPRQRSPVIMKKG